jgi:hypothetical protein
MLLCKFQFTNQPDKTMNPDSWMVPGAAVEFHPQALPDAEWRWRDAYLIYTKGDNGHRVYVLYQVYGYRFIEMSQDAVAIKPIYRQTYTDRWNWMVAYVTALDTGSAELQGWVETLLRNSDDGYENFRGQNILEITTGNGYGSTLLHAAAELGRYKAAQMLLEPSNMINIDVNGLDTNGYTALYDACAFRRLDICKLLLEHGADFTCGKGIRRIKLDGISKILLLYGGDKNHAFSDTVREVPRVASILTRALCSVAPISRLPTDILRTYLLPLILDAE